MQPKVFQPRSYQKPGPQAILSGRYKRYLGVMHRRAGKDRTWWNFMIFQAMTVPGIYYYWLPTTRWAKRVIWNGVTNDGHRFMDDIPHDALDGNPNSTDLTIYFRNNSIIQLAGSDNVMSSLVGTNPIGNVFSEYAIGSPDGWEYIRPILSENKGWAAFIYTPRGHNHGYKLFNLATSDPKNWFCELLTVNDTVRDAPGEDGTPVITEEDIELERKSGMVEELVQQEFYCSFAAFVAGSYFGKQIEHLREVGKICRVAYDPNFLVHTAWDLGINNAMAIWFFQLVGNEIHVIEYLEGGGEGLPFYIEQLRQRPYLYGDHLAPHDIQVRELTTGVSRWETAHNLGITFTPVDRLPKQDQRNAVYSILGRCLFDEYATEPGLTYLGEYHARRTNDGTGWKTPEHDKTSNAADAFQLLAVGITLVENTTIRYNKAITEFNPLQPTYVGNDFDPFTS